LNGDEVIKVLRLGNCENFLGKREELVFDAFSDPEPVERAYDGSDTDMTGLKSLDKLRSDQDVLRNYKADLRGIGNRSTIV